MKLRKKLIEVALPLEAINIASAKEKSIRHGHPSTLHLWWARRPLAAARAVIFAQMVDDPSSHPELFPTEEAQETERQRIFRILEKLVLWENTTNETVLNEAREEIWKSWRNTCEDNRDHPQAAELFNPGKLPAFHDPFAGGGALPLEAQRLGLESYASDLNPVAVMLNKAMIEIPPRFTGRKPVGPVPPGEKQTSMARDWPGATGLAEDVRRYGAWMRAEAEKRIGHLYPKVEITAEMVDGLPGKAETARPDLEPLVGQQLTVIAWLWARTVESPDPAFAGVQVPLASTFILSTKVGKDAYVEPVAEGKSYSFSVRMGTPPDSAISGTKLSRGANFFCLLSKTPIEPEFIKSEGRAGRLGTKLLAIVAASERGRVYLSPLTVQEKTAINAQPDWKPDTPLPDDPRNFWTIPYGLTTFGDLFTARQLIALGTLSDLVGEARKKIYTDVLASGFPDDRLPLDADGQGAKAYSEAVSVYLGLAVSRTTNTINALAVWSQSREQSVNLFSRQAIPMAWDFPEVNPFAGAAGDFGATTASIAKTLSNALTLPAKVSQANAQTQNISASKIISTDPPYYDNIAYADLSDFFYVWLRRSLKPVFPNMFATVAVPKAEELVATPYRHGGKDAAEAFFLGGMTSAMHRLAEQGHTGFPVTIYYAFKQSESDGNNGTSSTGWETFLDAVVQAGFTLTGTWPMRTERPSGVKTGTNSLASSIVLVCRRRNPDAPNLTRREFLNELKAEMPKALAKLQRSNIAPVDLQQAAIGPGMAIFSRYSNVVNAAGDPLTVKEALALINETLDDVLAQQEGDFDADTRWALTWFDQLGFLEGDFGLAETLSKAKNTSVAGMMAAGILSAGGGKVRLLKPEELDPDWEPETDTRKPVWEALHHLVRALNQGGETAAATLATRLGSRADVARELAYRLYILCERKKRAQEALAYNALVQSWPEIQRLASEAESRPAQPQQTSMFT
jgi:putative DNA methylase